MNKWDEKNKNKKFNISSYGFHFIFFSFLEKIWGFINGFKMGFSKNGFKKNINNK